MCFRTWKENKEFHTRRSTSGIIQRYCSSLSMSPCSWPCTSLNPKLFWRHRAGNLAWTLHEHDNEYLDLGPCHQPLYHKVGPTSYWMAYNCSDNNWATHGKNRMCFLWWRILSPSRQSTNTGVHKNCLICGNLRPCPIWSVLPIIVFFQSISNLNDWDLVQIGAKILELLHSGRLDKKEHW
jgi:hypothetical protein